MTVHPDLLTAVKRLYPKARIGVDVVLHDKADGKGPQLVEWNIPNSRPPTAAQIKEVLATPVIPQIVPMALARRALAKFGLLDAVENHVAEQSQDVQITWEYATELDRQSSLVASLGLTPNQVDQLFIIAATLTPL